MAHSIAVCGDIGRPGHGCRDSPCEEESGAFLGIAAVVPRGGKLDAHPGADTRPEVQNGPSLLVTVLPYGVAGVGLPHWTRIAATLPGTAE